jgi:hypothetical protein
MSTYYAAVSTLIFAVVVGHAVRLVNRWAVHVGPFSVPMSVSWLGLVIAALISVWGFTQISPIGAAGPKSNVPSSFPPGTIDIVLVLTRLSPRLSSLVTTTISYGESQKRNLPSFCPGTSCASQPKEHNPKAALTWFLLSRTPGDVYHILGPS